MRLDKYLSDMGIGTRTELKKMIRKGQVSVNGVAVKDPGCDVSEDAAVTVNGALILYETLVYYMLHKPAGIISASEDPREATVIDLLPEPRRKDLFPVGRLDRDTEGLLLITNDGDLAHRLLSPKHHVDKVYYARVSGQVTASDVAAFRKGLVLTDGLECMPAELEVLSVNGAETEGFQSEVRITIREGKFHQIKRMFQAIGMEVLYLKRLSMGPLQLDPELKPGESRRLMERERMALK
ncbi:MAG: rRNA pseudouridine synthase [Clostridia bacterium]|nr:rRNA pseudouridine synthase [Clostridia bacterium]